MMSHAPYDPPRMPPIDAADLISAALRARRPFSLVRLGDGELAMLGLGAETPRAHGERALRIWLGPGHAPLERFAALAEELRGAVRNADLVGIPRVSRQRAEEYVSYVAPVFANHALHRESLAYTDASVHSCFQHMRAPEEWLRGRDFVGLITCREVAAELAAVFGIGRVLLHRVPADFLTAQQAAQPPHYPDVYEKLWREIDPPYRGALYLVGAGAFGKVYCDWIKARGGVALDIGSLFDGWAGVHVRERMETRKEQYSLERYRVRLERSARLAEYREVIYRNVGALLPREEVEFLVSQRRAA